MQIYDNTKFHILQYEVLHKLFPSNLYNLIFSSAAAFWSVGSLPGRNTMRRLPLRSPPRMRGKVIVRSRNAVQIGITPAYAGKRQRRATACTWLRDHPRVCGEKDAICKSCPARQGSPSRMRGKAGWPLYGLPCIGITPAYAGKSQPWRSYSQRRWDHPRVCGEKRPAVDGKRPLRGSPPHVRGKVKDPVPVSALVGITPACAGKRSAQAGAPAGRRDHPRVCGEKFNSGSMLKQMGDHPRVCGEKQCFE